MHPGCWSRIHPPASPSPAQRDVGNLLGQWAHEDDELPKAPRDRGFWSDQKSSLQDKVILLPTLPSGRNQTVLFCQAPKTGSTAWLHVFGMAYCDHIGYNSHPVCRSTIGALRQSFEQNRTVERRTILETNPHCFKWSHGLAQQQVYDILQDPSTASVTIVRDPYARLLSAFLDKVPPAPHHLKHVPTMPATVDNFQRFVETYILSSSGQPVDPHFQLQTQLCKGNFVYHLKLEDMPFWYEPFIQLLGFEDAVASGWNVSTPYWRGSSSPCFYTVPGKSCDQMFAARDNIGDQLLSMQSGNANGKSSHSRNTSRMLRMYYANRSFTERVTSFLMPDLAQYGYTPWFGPPDKRIQG